jgi:hypothetical protein
MQWSERPPAARLRSASLISLRSIPRSRSVAVAHLILVRSMRAASFLALIITFVCAAAEAGSGEAAIVLPEWGKKLIARLSPDADQVISVLGCVRNPRTILPAEGLTVTKAIELAGGFGDFASRGKVGLWKSKEGRYFTVDVKAVAAKTADVEDPLLNAGDVVLVNQRVDYF